VSFVIKTSQIVPHPFDLEPMKTVVSYHQSKWINVLRCRWFSNLEKIDQLVTSKEPPNVEGSFVAILNILEIILSYPQTTAISW
jgi:hypothetical protein